MSTKQKDFIERLGMTLLLAAVSFGIVYLADAPEPWALAVLGVLQVVKNLIAQQVGDPDTSGFTDPLTDEDDDNEDVGGEPIELTGELS